MEYATDKEIETTQASIVLTQGITKRGARVGIISWLLEGKQHFAIEIHPRGAKERTILFCQDFKHAGLEFMGIMNLDKF